MAKHRQLPYAEDTPLMGRHPYDVSKSCADLRGVRWNDPEFGIAWPVTDGVILNERDRSYADFESIEVDRDEDTGL